MELLDINGRSVSIRPVMKGFKKPSRSKLQLTTRNKVIEKFPHEVIYEDFVIPGSRLSVDFFIYRIGLVIEVDGKQHSAFSSFHHGDRTTSKKFAKQRTNDMLKDKWSESNGFRMVRIESEEDLEQING